MVYSGTKDIPSKCEPNLGVLGDAAVVTAEEWTPCWRWTIRIYSALAAAALAQVAVRRLGDLVEVKRAGGGPPGPRAKGATGCRRRGSPPPRRATARGALAAPPRGTRLAHAPTRD